MYIQLHCVNTSKPLVNQTIPTLYSRERSMSSQSPIYFLRWFFTAMNTIGSVGRRILPFYMAVLYKRSPQAPSGKLFWLKAWYESSERLQNRRIASSCQSHTRWPIYPARCKRTVLSLGCIEQQAVEVPGYHDVGWNRYPRHLQWKTGRLSLTLQNIAVSGYWICAMRWGYPCRQM